MRELAQLLSQVLTDPMTVETLIETGQYRPLVRNLVHSVTNTFGGKLEQGPTAAGPAEYEVMISYTDNIPDNGGIWRNIDSGIDWSTDPEWDDWGDDDDDDEDEENTYE